MATAKTLTALATLAAAEDRLAAQDERSSAGEAVTEARAEAAAALAAVLWGRQEDGLFVTNRALYVGASRRTRTLWRGRLRVASVETGGACPRTDGLRPRPGRPRRGRGPYEPQAGTNHVRRGARSRLVGPGFGRGNGPRRRRGAVHHGSSVELPWWTEGGNSPARRAEGLRLGGAQAGMGSARRAGGWRPKGRLQRMGGVMRTRPMRRRTPTGRPRPRRRRGPQRRGPPAGAVAPSHHPTAPHLLGGRGLRARPVPDRVGRPGVYEHGFVELRP